MRICSFILVLVLLASVANGVRLADNWERSTCKIQKSPTVDSFGTGFILRYKGEVFIVTNKHVISPGESKFYIGLNPAVPDTINGTPINKTDTDYFVPPPEAYFADPKYDLAFVRLADLPPILDIAVIPQSAIGVDSMIGAGREVFFLGYPGALSGYKPRVPLVRSAIVAGDQGPAVLLDGNIFGGSSGSPVFLAADLDNGASGGRLIGVISQAFSVLAHTVSLGKAKQPAADVLVQENLGIGVAIKISYVVHAIDDWLSKH
jgi:hypothetical protein